MKDKKMITHVNAINYRSFRYISCHLQKFQVIAGPNGSGKSVFLDIFEFLSDFIRLGINDAIKKRASDTFQFPWNKHNNIFEISIKSAIPEEIREKTINKGYSLCLYKIIVDTSNPISILSENFWLMPNENPYQGNFSSGWRQIIYRCDNIDKFNFWSDSSDWNSLFYVSADKSALVSLPEDKNYFPVVTWFRKLLIEGIQRLVLSSKDMRLPSPPSRARSYQPDCSNLPWIIHSLEKEHPDQLQDWIAHVREALPDIDRIETREREEDQYRYIVLHYKNGLSIPSWLISNGTLRLLALTLLAYIPDLSGIYLIEEPENGIHPRAIETIYQSLSSVYGSQVLLTTHSPTIINLAKPKEIIFFTKDEYGLINVVPGNEHPKLLEWKGVPDLGTLFASGILNKLA
jgi:predicted ATP-binding protein involved in virulence